MTDFPQQIQTFSRGLRLPQGQQPTYEGKAILCVTNGIAFVIIGVDVRNASAESKRTKERINEHNENGVW
jgi:hypothetical protein